MKIISAGALGISLLGFSTLSYSNSKSDDLWIKQSHCRSTSQFQAPDIVKKSNLFIIGVDIGPSGEIIRMHPNTKVLNALPEYFSPTEHLNLFDTLSKDDFEKYEGEWGDWTRTPLDFRTPADISVLYVLLPEAWSYSSPAMSLKTKAKPWKHPQLNLPKQALTNRTALLHRANQNFHPKQKCRYEFNLHVTITQEENGKTLKTPIIIDPGADNDSRGGGGQQGQP